MGSSTKPFTVDSVAAVRGVITSGTSGTSSNAMRWASSYSRLRSAGSRETRARATFSWKASDR